MLGRNQSFVSWSSAHREAGVSGVVVSRLAISGNAAAMVLPMAAGALMRPASPTPFVPRGG
jgi:hypothetical protein